ncbi:tetratricopeptide repeat protein 1 [Scyliorhinus canicula]|uniref:tetratricopeptide repeat protein 1 n=1 Tax=Scyliorhinus canicula TaxID=7830 RepID=UPI0018F5F08E|nr:tetratricopeptide repeat protein 1 [Scyliorhinus canicula]XP_038651387.1 tetratricopeptide repeat protein 1 [Scyliorhinus canicula]XP_038651388.1 tetratricopeptide repeat protein 1 [Scyliorhinus canicula]
MDRESEDAELSEKLGTVLNVSAGEREKQTVPTEHLNCESDSGELSPVKVDPSGASGNAEKPCIADGETAEDHFFECRESLGTDGFVGMEDDVVNLELEDDSETTEAKKLEFDEEYLRELEKDLPEEEKKRRQGESLTLKEVGNGQFKKGEYTEAENSYTEALGVCPAYYQKDRSILYSNRAAARMKLDNKEEAISDCTKAIELNPNYIRAILRRAELYEKSEKLDEALQDYKTILEKDPSVGQARDACMRLPQQIEERNEKMKEEMLGKLKDLGNMVLRPFGLSTENFLLNKDPNSGSYSINFVQNPNNNNR